MTRQDQQRAAMLLRRKELRMAVIARHFENYPVSSGEVVGEAIAMNRQELLEALAAAEAEFASRERWGFGPDGFGPLPPEEPRPPVPAPPLKRARPRKNSKQGRRERGGIV